RPRATVSALLLRRLARCLRPSLGMLVTLCFSMFPVVVDDFLTIRMLGAARGTALCRIWRLRLGRTCAAQVRDQRSDLGRWLDARCRKRGLHELAMAPDPEEQRPLANAHL